MVEKDIQEGKVGSARPGAEGKGAGGTETPRQGNGKSARRRKKNANRKKRAQARQAAADAGQPPRAPAAGEKQPPRAAEKTPEPETEKMQQGTGRPEAAPVPPAAPEPPETPPSATPGAPAGPSADPDGKARTADAEKAETAELAEEAEEERAAEITRTVQVSIEQIMASVQAGTGDAPPPDTPDAPPGEADEENDADGDDDAAEPAEPPASGLLKWLLLVVALVALVAGAGIAWLYHGATLDALPTFAVTFDGQSLTATAYDWQVPVVGNLFKRTYRKTLSETPAALGEVVATADPDLEINTNDYDASLTIYDADGESVFSGSPLAFDRYTFTENGSYTGELVLSAPESKFSQTGNLTGSQTYRFSFEISIRPAVRLNTASVTQGGVAAVRVSGLADGETPVLQTELETTGFYATASGWVAYLPIPYNQKVGTYSIQVVTSGYNQAVELTVRARTDPGLDVSRASQLTSPYISLADTPEEVQSLLAVSDEEMAWAGNGFTMPFSGSMEITLSYGITEYVGRTNAQRAAGTGSGRTSTNVVVATKNNSALVAPAAGRVLLAKKLDGAAGYTVVIEHGAGVKSIFYCLNSIAVVAGQNVAQGETIAATGKATVGEVRIGTVAVEPLAVWRGQCDALKYY